MQNKASDKKFSIGEASKFLGVSIDTLRRWEKAGKIKALRSPGGHRYFLKSDLERAFGQRYSRSAPSQEPAKPTQIQTPEPPLAPLPLPSAPDLELTTPPSVGLEENTTEPPPQPSEILDTEPDEVANLTPQEAPVEAVSPEPPVATEPLISQYPQTSEKRYTVEEITSPTPPLSVEPSISHEVTPEKKEASTEDITQPPAISPSDAEPLTQTEKFDEPLSSFNTPPPPPTQPLIQSSQKEVQEVTVTPQQKKDSSTLKKISLFLLIVFMMVNIILIGFYIFVSKQL